MAGLHRELKADANVKDGLLNRASGEVQKTLGDLNEALKEKKENWERNSEEVIASLENQAAKIREKLSFEAEAGAEGERRMHAIIEELIEKIREEIQVEKKERESGEETLLLMLENVCSKMQNVGSKGRSTSK